MSTQSPAPCGTAHFCLSDEQEHQIFRVRLSLAFISELADSSKPGATLPIEADGLSCLLSILAEQLPTAQDLLYQTCTGEPS